MVNNADNNTGNATDNTRSAIKDGLIGLGNKGLELCRKGGGWVWNHKTISALIASGIFNCFAVKACYDNKQDAEEYKQEARTYGQNADENFLHLQDARDSIANLEMGKQMDEKEIEALKQELKDCKNDSLTAYRPRKEIQAAAKDLGLVCSRIRKSIGLDSASLNNGILIIKDKVKGRFARDSVTIDNEQYPFTNDGQRATYYCDGHSGSIELSDNYLIVNEHIPGGTFQETYEYKDGKMNRKSTKIELFSADGIKIYTKYGNIIVIQHLFDNGISLERTYNLETGDQISGQTAE